MARRGITDFEARPGRRLAGRALRRGRGDGPAARARCVAFVKPQPGDSEWAHPVDGVIALVDLNRLEVLRVDDHGVVPIPPESGNFDVARRRRRCATTSRRSRSRSPTARASRSTGRVLSWQRWQRARRLHAARGPRAQPGRLRRRRAAALDPLPRLALGDGRALRRPQPEPLLEERLRRRRERRRHRRLAAHARLRLPGRDRLPRRGRLGRRGRGRVASRTRSASTRRTPACSGGTSSGATARARCAARAGS